MIPELFAWNVISCGEAGDAAFLTLFRIGIEKWNMQRPLVRCGFVLGINGRYEEYLT